MKSKKVAVLFARTILLVGLFSILSCQPPQSGKNADNAVVTPATRIYKGDLRVSIDEGLSSIMQQQTDVFSFLYDSVHLQVAYGNEAQAMDEFRQRKSNVLILARELTPNERQLLQEHDTIYAREMRVAYDAVALVAHPNFDDQSLTLDMLKQYFSATQAQPNLPKLVFDHQQSSSVSYVMRVLGYREKISSQVYALPSSKAVIDYVANSDNVIGFVPYSYLSDTDDDSVKAMLKRIKILSLRVKNEQGEIQRISANQSAIADGRYPLIREVNAITRFSYEDNLEWLFVNFLYKEKGARIFLKAGLIPANMPEREIIVNTESVKASK